MTVFSVSFSLYLTPPSQFQKDRTHVLSLFICFEQNAIRQNPNGRDKAMLLLVVVVPFLIDEFLVTTLKTKGVPAQNQGSPRIIVVFRAKIIIFSEAISHLSGLCRFQFSTQHYLKLWSFDKGYIYIKIIDEANQNIYV